MTLDLKGITLTILFFAAACGSSNNDPPLTDNDGNSHVVAVTSSGSDNNYTFSVTVKSPDTGCDQYADWWEVISEEGELIYRRILAHSHVSEQPFERSGGPVAINENTIVWIRSHMNNSGYGGDLFKGSVSTGFSKQTPPDNFAASIEDQAPQPTDCAF